MVYVDQLVPVGQRSNDLVVLAGLLAGAGAGRVPAASCQLAPLEFDIQAAWQCRIQMGLKMEPKERNNQKILRLGRTLAKNVHEF